MAEDIADSMRTSGKAYEAYWNPECFQPVLDDEKDDRAARYPELQNPHVALAFCGVGI